MGWVSPTAHLAKQGYQGSQYDPGWIDRVFNTTIGIFQQPLWRMWRALKEEDIDLLSKQGILDPALLPGFGMLFDPEHTVMPDELFGDNFGAQLAGSILTDPLSFMVAPLTSTAKIAKLTSAGLSGGAGRAATRKLSKAVAEEGGEALLEDTTAAFHRAAKFGSNKWDEVADPKLNYNAFKQVQKETTVDQMLAGIEHAKKNGGFFDSAGTMMSKVTGKELLDLTKLGDELATLPKEFRQSSLGALLKEQGKRNMGLGPPILGDFFGVYIAPPKFMSKHGGWLKWYFNTVKKTYTTPAKLGFKLLDPIIGKSPFITRQVQKTQNVVSEAVSGFKRGPETVAALKFVKEGFLPALNGEAAQAASGPVAKKVYNQAYALRGNDALTLTDNHVPASTHAELVISDILSEAETAGVSFLSQLSRRFGGDGLDLISTTDYAKLDIDAQVKAATADLSTFLYRKRTSTLSAETHVFGDEMFDLDKDIGTTFAYRLGKDARLWYNKAFKSDLGLNNSDELGRFLNRIEAANSQHSEAVGDRLYKGMAALSKELGQSPEVVESVMLSALASSIHPDEIMSFAGHLSGGSSTSIGGLVTELSEFLEGRVRGYVEQATAIVAENFAGGTDEMQKLLDALLTGEVTTSRELKFLSEATEGAKGDPAITRLINTTQDITELSFSSSISKLGAEGSRKGKAITSVDPKYLFGTKGGELQKQAGMLGHIKSVRSKLTVATTRIAKLSGTEQKEALADLVREFPTLFAKTDELSLESALDALWALKADEAALVRYRGVVEEMGEYSKATSALTPSGSLVPTFTKQVNYIGEFATGEKITLENIGKALGDTPEDVGVFVELISSLRLKKDALARYVQIRGADDVARAGEIPTAFIEGFRDDLEMLSGLMRDAVLKPLSVGIDGAPTSAARLYDEINAYRNALFTTGRAHSILPTSATPLGYMPRVVSGEQFNILTKALKDYASGSAELSTAIAPTLAATRKYRSATVQQLDELVNRLGGPEFADSDIAGLLDVIKRTSEHLTGSGKYKVFSTDPIASLVAHGSKLQEAIIHKTWFEELDTLGAEFGVIQGKVVDVEVDIADATKLPVPTPLKTQVGPVPTATDVPMSAAEALNGVKAYNTGKTEFDVLMPENFWAANADTVDAAVSKKARDTVQKLYDNKFINESGALLLWGATRSNPELYATLGDVDISAGVARHLRELKKTELKGLQTEYAVNFLGTLATATVKALPESVDIKLTQDFLLQDLGEAGFTEWLVRNFKVSKEVAEGAIDSTEEFISIIASSALTRKGLTKLESIGLGRFIKSFVKYFKDILNKALKVFVGGRTAFLDPKTHQNVASHLEDLVRGAAGLSDSGGEQLLSTVSSQKIKEFIVESYRNQLKPLLDQELRDLGLADGFSAFERHLNKSNRLATTAAVDLNRVAKLLGLKSTKELDAFLSIKSELPQLSYEEAGVLAGLTETTPWDGRVGNSILEIETKASREIAEETAQPMEGLALDDFAFDAVFDEAFEEFAESSRAAGSTIYDARYGGRKLRDIFAEAEAEEFISSGGFQVEKAADLEGTDLLPRGPNGELDLFHTLEASLTKTEMRQAGLFSKWISGGFAEQADVKGKIADKLAKGGPFDTGSWTGVKRIISGGQDGVDRIGLQWAKSAGLETGGTAPVGFVTAGKPYGDVSLSSEFGLVEIDDAALQAKHLVKRGPKIEQPKDYYTSPLEGTPSTYGARTERNVLDADVTVIFARDTSSIGTVQTIRFAEEHNRPYIVNPSANQLRNFVAENRAEVINIAGNRPPKVSKSFKSNQWRAKQIEKETQKINQILTRGLSGFDEHVAPAAAKGAPLSPFNLIRRQMAIFDDKFHEIRDARPDLSLPTGGVPRTTFVAEGGGKRVMPPSRAEVVREPELLYDSSKYWRFEPPVGSVPGMWRFDHEGYNKAVQAGVPTTPRSPVGKRMSDLVEERERLLSLQSDGTAMSFKDGEVHRGITHKMMGKHKGKSTFSLIKSGHRTATTRKGKNALKGEVGDIVKISGPKGEKDIFVRITKKDTPVSKIKQREWSSKEGWNRETYNKYKKRGYYQTEFEYLKGFDPDSEIAKLEKVIPMQTRPAGFSRSTGKRYEEFTSVNTAQVFPKDGTIPKMIYDPEAKTWVHYTQREGRMMPLVDTTTPALTPRQQTYIDEVLTPNINNYWGMLTDAHKNRANYLAKVRTALDKGRKIRVAKLAKEHARAVKKEFKSMHKILDAVLDAGATDPTIYKTQVALDEVARAKFNLPDLQRLTARYVTNTELKMTKEELSVFQGKLAKFLGDREEAYTAVNANRATAGVQDEMTKLLKEEQLTKKEVEFLNKMSDHAGDINKLVKNGSLSSSNYLSPGARWGAKATKILNSAQKSKQILSNQEAKFLAQDIPELFKAMDGAGEFSPEAIKSIGVKSILSGKRAISSLRDQLLPQGSLVPQLEQQRMWAERLDSAVAAANKKTTESILGQGMLPDKANIARPTLQQQRDTTARRVLEQIGEGKQPKPYSYVKSGGVPPAGSTPPTVSAATKAQAAAKVTEGSVGSPHQKMRINAIDDPDVREISPFHVVIETNKGQRLRVPGEAYTQAGFTLRSIGKGEDLGEALRHVAKTGAQGKSLVDGTRMTPNSVWEMVGHQVTMAPSGINDAIHSQLLPEAPSKIAGALKWYDNIHTLMKYFTTSLRVPFDFHFTNTLGSFPMAFMEDVPPRFMMQGMFTSFRMISEDVDQILGLERAAASLHALESTSSGVAFPKLITQLPEIASKGRLLSGLVGGGDSPVFKQGDALLFRGGGNTFEMSDIVQALIEEGGLDTMVRSDFVNITASDNAMEFMRNKYFSPTAAQQIQAGVQTATESSEVLVRFSAMFGALASGMDLQTAARTVAKAMVDYADSTNIERALFKRLGFFYTFPRKMLPKTARYLVDNPSRGAALVNAAIKPKEHVKTSEGRVEVAFGDYRVNIGRIAPQVDTMVAIAAVADTFVPALGNLRPRRVTGEAAPDRPITPSGLANIFGWEEFFPTEDPLAVSSDWLESATSSNWVIKMLVGDPVMGSRDPKVNYSPLELMSRSILPYRKVRPGQEEQQMLRRIQAHHRRYKRKHEEALAANLVPEAEALAHDIKVMDTRMRELKSQIAEIAREHPELLQR
jgi:uncharacterized protein (DUF305 family)